MASSQGAAVVVSSHLLSLVDEEVTLEVIRQGEAIEVEVTIGELPGDSEQILSRAAPVEKGLDVLGMTVEELTAEQKEQMQVEHGVIVTEVESGPARKAGIMRGDVIVQMLGRDVVDTATLQEIVDALPDKSVPVLIKRENRSTFLALRKDSGE